MWEAVEGGTGAWERMVEEPEAFAEVSIRYPIEGGCSE
jgi:hypothetical protein